MKSTVESVTHGASEPVAVLGGRPLRSGIDLADTAKFDDDAWPLAPANMQEQARAHVLHFDTIPSQYRLAAKRLAYAGLSGHLPEDEPRPSIASIVSRFYTTREFFRWLQKEQDGCAIREITADVLRRYTSALLGRVRARDRRHSLRAGVVFLWRYRNILLDQALQIDPRLIPGWTEPRAVRPPENATDRIPEQVHGRLLVWALRFVDDFSDDILRAIDRWDELRTQRRTPLSQSAAGTLLTDRPAERVRKFVQRTLDERQPLPSTGATSGDPSFFAIARLLRVDRRVLEPFQVDILGAAAIVGTSEYVYLGATVRAQLDGRPWIAGVCLEPKRQDSITVLAQMLQAACYIVVAFLSGMRDSEVKHLRVGCASVERDSNGIPYRWKVASLAFKGEVSDRGVPATWIVGEPAARAIAVLERLQGARNSKSADWLFAVVRTGPGAGSGGRGGNGAMTAAGTNSQLNRFVSWINNYCVTQGRSDSIPNVDGKPWKLTTRQFRRTLAWYVARRPGGAIAGAIAYRHHSIQMFEGYAGTSASGFRAEVEAEQALARGAELLLAIDQHTHTSLAGPAADEAERRLTEMGERARFEGVVTSDRRRLLRLMTRNDPAVYPGRYNTCVYDHKKALCRDRSAVAATPDLTACKPLACHNVALTAENRAVWQRELEAIQADLSRRPLLPPALLSRLEDRRQAIVDLLNRQLPSND